MAKTSGKADNRKDLDQDLYAELRGESERAAAIFGAAILDELLRKVLLGFLIDLTNKTTLRI